MGPLDPKINNGAIGPSKRSYFTRLITTRNPNGAPCFEWSLGLLLEDETTPKIEDMSRFQVVIYNPTRRGPLTTISGFIPSYTHLQPWLNRVCWGYNYLITRGAPSCTYNWLVGPTLYGYGLYFCCLGLGSPHLLDGWPTLRMVEPARTGSRFETFLFLRVLKAPKIIRRDLVFKVLCVKRT